MRCRKFARSDVHSSSIADKLSPLGLKHINMLGRYAFTLPDLSHAGNSDRCAIRQSTMGVTREILEFRNARQLSR
jgi:hypothetical protein